MSDRFAHVKEELDLLVAERKEIATAGPHFHIVHEYRSPGAICAAGEVVAAIHLIHRAREFSVPLSLTLRLFFDFLARHARLAQSATEISFRFLAEEFYKQHGSNLARDGKLRRGIAR